MSDGIREGKVEDLNAALALIRELATYEKAPKEVEVTLEQMKDWGFGPNAIFRFFVAEQQGRVIGLALYYFKYSTWKGRCMFLEDIIVTETERRKGWGHRLFAHIVQEAKKENVKRLEWQVLEWNEPAIAFYRKYGAEFDGEWVNCKLTNIQIQSM